MFKKRFIASVLTSAMVLGSCGVASCFAHEENKHVSVSVENSSDVEENGVANQEVENDKQENSEKILFKKAKKLLAAAAISVVLVGGSALLKYKYFEQEDAVCNGKTLGALKGFAEGRLKGFAKVGRIVECGLLNKVLGVPGLGAAVALMNFGVEALVGIVVS